jgi:peptidoglycan/xylan/chitin deacetylase (PgdA/CDA1 family)
MFKNDGMWQVVGIIRTQDGQTVNAWISDIRPVKPRGTVIFTVDDVAPEGLLMNRILEHYGWRSTMFVSTGLVGGEGIGWEQIATEAARGHIVACHGHDHSLQWGSASVAAITADLQTALDLLRSHGYGSTCQYLATPYGQTGPNARQVARSLVKCMRLTGPAGPRCSGLPGRDPFVNLQPTSLYDANLSNVEDAIDAADSYGALLIIMGHKVCVGSATTIVSPWAFDALCQYIRAKTNLVVTDLHTFWQNEMENVRAPNATLGGITL